MAKTYHLVFVVRGLRKNLVFEVRKKESDRLRALLNDAVDTRREFFWFEALKGESVCLNLGYVQAVRFLWDMTPLPPDVVRSKSNIRLRFVDRGEVIETFTDDEAELFDLFTALEHGVDFAAYPSFDDEDGETFQVNPAELLWISAPTDLLKTGEKKRRAEGA